jgi:D-alanyl-D-alanine carboxypeptidase
MRMSGRSIVGTALAILALTLAQGGAHAGPSLVVDLGSGSVLHADEATRPWYPASLSKLMTAFTVFKAIGEGRVSLGTPIVISPRAARMAPSKIGYPAGTFVTIDDALKMLMVQSANDIAVALAEGTSGSVEAFANEMNANSRALGMLQSHWVNPNGLPDAAQVSSARDMAVLARAILRDYPQYTSLFAIQAIQSGKRVMRTHNALIYRYPGADGMKTGFICASGFNVVATATRSGRKLIAVILGAPSEKVRTRMAAGLFEDGFHASGGFFTASATLDDLPTSPYTTATDIREIACSRRRGAPAPQDEDAAEAATAPQPGPRGDGVMATLLAQHGGGSLPASASPLLTSWVIDPPIQVGPYKGPRRPASAGPAMAASPPAAGAVPAAATSYADPVEKPVVLPTQPVEASTLLPPALGAIRPGTGAAEASTQPLPGQIPRSTANPLKGLASDPLPVTKARRKKATADATSQAVPAPAARPRKKKATPQG